VCSLWEVIQGHIPRAENAIENYVVEQPIRAVLVLLGGLRFSLGMPPQMHMPLEHSAAELQAKDVPKS